MSEEPATAETARDALIAAIAQQAVTAPNATTLLRLAEAYAWVVEPAQPHGGVHEK
ncbi:MAG: hypothetical protein K2X91_16895 [Thermoleophilia bacterium]|nr:hypothetical protein [Thermoleophilia bacterium]